MRISRKQLLEGLEVLALVTPKSPNPLLSQVHFRSAEGQVYLAATDGSREIELAVAGDGVLAGPFLLHPAALRAYLKCLPSELVELDVQEQLRIETDSGTARFAIADAHGWPALLEAWPERWVSLSPEALATLQTVGYAVATEDFRGIFRGVQLELTTDSVRAIAADGYRLAAATVNVDAQPLQGRYVVHGRMWRELARLARRGVQLSIAERRLWAQAEGLRFAVPLMDGELPDYERLLPSSFSTRLTLSRPAFLAATQRMRALADETHHRMDWSLFDRYMTVSTASDRGQITEQLEASLSGERLELAVNAQFLQDALANAGGEEVIIDFSGPSSPLIVRGSGTLGVVVPLRVTDA